MLRNVIQKNNSYLFKRILTDIKDWNCNLPKAGIRYPTTINFSQSHAYQSRNVLITNYSGSSRIISVRSKTTVVKEAETTKKEEGTVDVPKAIKVEALTRRETLQKALKEYGSTVIVFHVGISLISLGSCYLLVSSGLDISKIFEMLGLQEWLTKSEAAASAGTFAVAYAVHKVFAPARIAITLTSVPFIVRYLRRIGFLKK